MAEPPYQLLNKVNYPAELRMLRANQLPQLCDELRRFLIETISRTGGHLAAGLGTVCLTLRIQDPG